MSALKKYNLKQGVILSMDNNEKEEKINKKIIKFIPLWKWLLNF